MAGVAGASRVGVAWRAWGALVGDDNLAWLAWRARLEGRGRWGVANCAGRRATRERKGGTPLSGEGGRAGSAGAGDALGRRRVAGAAEAGINMQADEPAEADMHLLTRMATASVNHAVRIGTYLNFQIDIGMY